MMPRSRLFTMGLLAIIWLIGMMILIHHADEAAEWINLAVCTLVFGIALYLLFYMHKRYNKLYEKYGLLKVGSQSLTDQIEIGIFDSKGKIRFATHPTYFTTQKEWLKKLSLRFQESESLDCFKQWVENHYSGELLLSTQVGQGNHIQEWFIAGVYPFNVGDEPYVYVSFRNITKYYKNHNQMRQNVLQLERFIDFAPFGIMYLDDKDKIKGVNQTTCHWLDQTKEQILETNLSHWVDAYEKDQNTQVVKLTLPSSQKIKALLVKTNAQEQKTYLLCRLTEDMDISALSDDQSHLSHTSFVKAPVPSVILARHGSIQNGNDSFKNLFPQKISNLFDLVDDKNHSILKESIEKVMNREKVPSFELNFKEGFEALSFISPLSHDQAMIQFMDISDQKNLKEQIVQSQKMQAVGQLAGGVAHDFNNLLTAMIGFCDLLLQRYLPNDPAYMDVMQIKQNANRASNLVRQLLAFSRQQTLQPRVLKVTDILAELSALLRRLIGADIDLDVVHGRGLSKVKVDQGQFEQVIINLVVNARDAMEKGGKITIKTSNFQSGEVIETIHSKMPKGDYILIEIIDEGHGIPKDILNKIFDPFFSTKEVGRGTGLGLSTVFGIVQQTGGYIDVDSTPDKGSTFKIYLPSYEEKPQDKQESTEKEKIEDLTGGGKILLVEDEDAVRLFSSRALKEKGYEVIDAASGEEALDLIKQGTTFDLLVTDVVMPKIDGPTLNQKVRAKYPDTKTIFISGYAEDTFRESLDKDQNIHFLPKPFNLNDLAAKVKQVI